MESRTLEIRLGDESVGHLTWRSTETTAFVPLASWVAKHPRRVLGQAFEDDPARIRSARVGLPEFFANLLPEGDLRELISKEQGVDTKREFFILERLGLDLPGAIVAVPVDYEQAFDEPGDSSTPAEGTTGPLKFSLAGVQLKFSMLWKGKGLTLPAKGEDGDWIVKLPGSIPRVPLVEYSVMKWAAASGIETPEFSLVSVANLSGLPLREPPSEPDAFAIRRYDRSQHGRIHQEDFAQVLEVFPGRKYERAPRVPTTNYTSVARIILSTCGTADFHAFLRRLVFCVASGNGDMHLKNISLHYPDGYHARLAPAYDLVSTRLYPGVDDGLLALPLSGSKSYEDVTLDSFLKLARKVDLDAKSVADTVRDAATRIVESWLFLKDRLDLTDTQRARIEAHLRVVPLLGYR